MKGFYNKIVDLLKDTDVPGQYWDRELPCVEYIDLYRGQHLSEDNFELFVQSTLLLEWTIDYREAVATVTFYVCMENLHDSSAVSLNREKALRFLDFVEITRNVLENIESPSTGKLQLVNER